MSQAILTAILTSFVVGGGVFIFGPDLKNSFRKKVSPKKSANINYHEVYLEYYGAEDELIEAAEYVSTHSGTSLSQIRRLIAQRGISMERLLAKKEPEHRCPVCGVRNGTKYSSMDIACRCNNGLFKEKMKKMFTEHGFEIW